VLYLALLSCSLCYAKLHVVHVLLFGQIKKEGRKEGRNVQGHSHMLMTFLSLLDHELDDTSPSGKVGIVCLVLAITKFVIAKTVTVVFFYRAMHFSAKRGIAIACCLSVCLSVTLVNCDHIGWNSSKIITPLVSLGCSLFATQHDGSAPRGTPLNFGPK